MESDNTLRPYHLQNMVGQEHIKTSLSVFIRAAQLRGDPLDHVLLKGPPGLGKTTIAHAICHAVEGKMLSCVGEQLTLSMMQDWADAAFFEASASCLVFIDEVHAAPKAMLEQLYSLMEDFEFGDLLFPNGFTLIAATTEPHKLPRPFIDRFGIDYDLTYYTLAELETIGNRSLSIMAPALVTGAGVMSNLARRSRGTPRVMNRLLRRCIDFALVAGSPLLSPQALEAAMRSLGIDEVGLSRLDRRLLAILLERFTRPVSLATLAAALGEDVEVVEKLEPWLVYSGFLQRTARGRVITPRGQRGAVRGILERQFE